jgi:hypothetical protein
VLPTAASPSSLSHNSGWLEYFQAIPVAIFIPLQSYKPTVHTQAIIGVKQAKPSPALQGSGKYQVRYDCSQGEPFNGMT